MSDTPNCLAHTSTTRCHPSWSETVNRQQTTRTQLQNLLAAMWDHAGGIDNNRLYF